MRNEATIPEITPLSDGQTAKLADTANLKRSETAVTTPTEAELYAEIARLWKANNVNRYDLGEKLCQLKEQAKHGEWMSKVEAMGIKQRTVNSLMEYYREEYQKRNLTGDNAYYPDPFKVVLNTSVGERKRYDRAIGELAGLLGLDSDKDVILAALLSDLTDEEWGEFESGVREIAVACQTTRYKDTILTMLRAALREVRRERIGA